MAFYLISREDAKDRLIEAATEAAAIRHVAKDVFTSSGPLKQAELVAAMKGGLSPEDAKAA